MKHRSWLIVPANNERSLGGCLASGADVVVLDLEDSVPVEHKGLARNYAAEWLAGERETVAGMTKIGRWVRINPMSTPMWREDLLAIIPSAPDGILLPKAEGAESVRQLAAELYEIEERAGVPANSTRIVPLVGETPRSALNIPEYLDGCHQRIAGLTWGAQDLAAAIAGTPGYRAGRGWSDVFKFVRAQTLLAAHATGVMAIDTSFTAVDDDEGLAAAATEARADGFTGMLAIHPGQIETINRAFTPSRDEIQEARDIVAAFDASPGTGSLQFNGRMIDKPHLKLARRILDGAGPRSGYADREREPILRPA